MRDYVFPKIGRLPVAEVAAADVIDVLKSIWFIKPETASRVLQRLKAVFDSAILRGMREKANPCIGCPPSLAPTTGRSNTMPLCLGRRCLRSFVNCARAPRCQRPSSFSSS
jgi:hypothetical protein